MSRSSLGSVYTRMIDLLTVDVALGLTVPPSLLIRGDEVIE